MDECRWLVGRLNARGEQQSDVPIVGDPGVYQDQVGALLTKPTYWQNAFATGYANSVTDANGKLRLQLGPFSTSTGSCGALHKNRCLRRNLSP